MPSNLYGPGGRNPPTHGHVNPALRRKFHEAKLHGASQVSAWGLGQPWREFSFSEDVADACNFLTGSSEDRCQAPLGSDECVTGRLEPPLVNVGVGKDMSLAVLDSLVARAVGHSGGIVTTPVSLMKRRES